MNACLSRGKGPLRLLLACICFAPAFAPTAAFAAASDCVEDDPVAGRFICFNREPLGMRVTRCENAPSSVQNQKAWCEAGSGVFNNPDCPGFVPENEENVEERSLAFLEKLTSSECAIVGDSGWNTPVDATSFCNSGIGAVYQEGYLVRDSRHIFGDCTDATVGFNGGSVDIRWYRSQSLACPFGSSPRSVFRNGTFVTACTIPVEPCWPCILSTAIGNPVSAAVGTKLEVATDYRNASGLEFARFYQSWAFPDPVSETPNGHTQGQLGATWRSNFDKRVIPVGNAPGIYALTSPERGTQYFNAQGLEIFNYGGGKASLVTLPGGGYVYQGLEFVETYRADGRLQSIARPSGETLTLSYSDGTNGPGGGNFVDALGNPTVTPFTPFATANVQVLPANLLLRVTDSYGNSLSFDYSAPGKLVVMTDPSGGRTLYTYDRNSGANDNLGSTTYPDGTDRSYRYTEQANLPSNIGPQAFPRALTSIVDENGMLYGTFKYDAGGRVFSEEHAGAERYQFVRGANTTTVTDPLGAVRTYTFQVVDGITRMTANSLTGGSGFGTGIKSQSYDAVGNLLSQVDFNNNQTCYAYDTARNLETARVEGLASTVACGSVTGAGAAVPAGARKITTEWDPRWRQKTRIAEPRRITVSSYNGASGSCAPAGAIIPDGSPNGRPIGVLCSRTVRSTTDADGSQGFGATPEGRPRAWIYTYDAHGHVLSIDGPRTDVSDVTLYAYYADNDPDPGKRGNPSLITNSLGHTTQILSYNAHGQPLTIVDPNGLITNLNYDLRRRLTSRNVGGEITTYGYDAVGQLVRVTLPNDSFLSYAYDAAHRLTGITDSMGNSIAYTLDAMGNRIQEQVFDQGGALAQTRSRVYDALNRLAQDIGAQSQTTQYAHDNQGNVTGVTDPLSHVTSNAYDALNRLVQVTDPENGVTRYAYNAIDQLVTVSDPRSLTTSYSYDGLSNLNSQASPDTGTTLNSYDSAGNLLSQIDAKNQITTYAYDALNRVTSISFADGSKQSYGYDQGANGLGRLTFFAETNPLVQITIVHDYAYDPHGRVVVENRTINGVNYAFGYSYDAAGRLSGMTYPSGRTVGYGFDAVGRISQVSTTAPPNSGGATQVVASNILYQPFGGVKSYLLGNGQTYSRVYDLDGRIATYGVGSQGASLGYDPAGRIVTFADAASGNSNAYGYDSMDRLTSAVTPAASYAYAYDLVGNRTSKTVGSATDSYTYFSSSNQIASISGTTSRSFAFDANGSTLADGNNQYSYDARGRMASATGATGTAFYQVNALGQRVRKTTVTDDRVFLYDLRGHLIAETSPTGGLKREYIYLNDIPLAVFQ
jgi:YD repeat-containing protein